jgi:hypothetical protein
VHGISIALDALHEAWIRVGHDIEAAWDHTVGGQADSEFITWLMRNIRIRGGDPRILTTKIPTLARTR